MGENLGKRLQVGDTFVTTTKKMDRDRSTHQWNDTFTGPRITFEVLRQGEERFFTKGKRRYFCKVLGLVQTTVGLWPGSIDINPRNNGIKKVTGKRWWQFSYMVEILEN